MYRDFLRDALRHVGPETSDRAKRQAFARIAYFVLRHLQPEEGVIADVLVAVTASTDQPEVVRILSCGVWAAVGDEDPRVFGWFSRIADRALAREHLAAFCVVLELVIHVPAFNGRISDGWLRGLTAAREDESAQRELFWVGWHWQQRFFSGVGVRVPAWLVELREDERVLAAAAVVEGERVALWCPACGKAFSP